MEYNGTLAYIFSIKCDVCLSFVMGLLRLRNICIEMSCVMKVGGLIILR